MRTKKDLNRCLTCGRFISEWGCEYHGEYADDSEELDAIENKQLDEMIGREFNPKNQNFATNSKSMQVYAEICEWLILNDKAYNSGEAWKEALLAKLRELLGL